MFNIKNILFSLFIIQILLCSNVNALLRFLIEADCLDEIQFVVEKGNEDVNGIQDTITKDTPLHDAVNIESLEIINLLLDLGADPRLQDWNGNTPLHFAVHKDNLSIVLKLLSLNLDCINIINNNKLTALDCCTSDEIKINLKRYGAKSVKKKRSFRLSKTFSKSGLFR